MPDCCAGAVESYSFELAAALAITVRAFHKAVAFSTAVFHVEHFRLIISDERWRAAPLKLFEPPRPSGSEKNELGYNAPAHRFLMFHVE
jgi:hypothetical protein